jgi:pyruvate/2-oxoglutarate dehydrogenase complex dihydrolipoamide acyltransferase (E2) component
MSLIEIKVPDIGDFSEVAVIELLVKPGDTIKAEQSLITVESDKASMEIPSSHAGVVKELKVKLGDKVAEGSVVLLLEASGAASAAPAAPAAPVSEQKQPNPGVVASPGAINVEASPAPAAASLRWRSGPGVRRAGARRWPWRLLGGVPRGGPGPEGGARRTLRPRSAACA